MRELPILFSGPMVRAILAGRKTQTRRAAKTRHFPPEFHVRCRAVGVCEALDELPVLPCPYGQPGDRLWVREAWQHADWTEDGIPWIGYQADGTKRLIEDTPDESAERIANTWAFLSRPENYDIDGRAADRRWRPSIHMPRWASRLTLEVTGVRVERLHEISEADILAEGMTVDVAAAMTGIPCSSIPTLHDAWRYGWQHINGAESWDANPWAWVVEFKGPGR